VRYAAAIDLQFNDPAGGPDEVMAAGTPLEPVEESFLSWVERDGIDSLRDNARKAGRRVEYMAFYWQGKARFLLVGTEARPAAPDVPAQRPRPTDGARTGAVSARSRRS
jgi:hypothetical protein